ncbi:MAG: 1-acyl-sn-glycerol-3-phosphate acyltransferase [Bacteroidales bacterium]|nr:1-acyl-sn-glycerol-3-phosphate acyltransferase [Bacteroidales bacterium]
MKTTIARRLELQREHIPNPIIYGILYLVVLVMKARLKTRFIFRQRPSRDKEPFVLVSNHASRNDYVFTAPAVWPHRLNYVVGYNEFFGFPNSLLLKFAQVIPKRNFVPDIHTIQSMMRIIRSGGHVMFMPEGMSSITGMAQPVMPGTGKLLKKLGVTVYYTKISGAYLCYTKHCLDERIGKTEVVVDRMFTKDELKELSDAQIEDRMNRLLAHDDYIWNSKAKVSYKGRTPMSERLDTLLYRCPRCGETYRMHCEGERMQCTACGNTIRIGRDYFISPATENDMCPPLVSDWAIMEREEAARMVREDGFSFSDTVSMGMLPEYKRLSGGATSIICGEGTLTLDSRGLHYTGTRKGEPWHFDIPIGQLPTFGMCTDISRFYTFIDGVFYEFYPKRGEVLLWDHLTEEMHRFQGGKWQNTPYRHTD